MTGIVKWISNKKSSFIRYNLVCCVKRASGSLTLLLLKVIVVNDERTVVETKIGKQPIKIHPVNYYLK